MATYDAYKIYYADAPDKPMAVVWWNGVRLQCSSKDFLQDLKDTVVDGFDFRAGKEFFDRIPRIYKSGYTYTRKTSVDGEGNEV